MHIFTTNSISVSNTKRTFICMKEKLALEMCWSQPVSSRGQNLASKTKQPFYRGTRRKCSIILQKQLLYHRISVKTMNVSGSVSQEHVNFCSSICVFCGLCFKTEEVIFATGTPRDGLLICIPGKSEWAAGIQCSIYLPPVTCLTQQRAAA